MQAWPAIFCAAILLAGCASGVEDFDSVDAPEWQPGYSYAYDYAIEGSVSGTAKVNGQTEKEDETISEAGPSHFFQVLSTSLGGGEPVYVAAAQVLSEALSETMGSEMDEGRTALAFRQRDLAAVEVDVDGSGLDFGTSHVETYLDFPLTSGKKWQSAAGESEMTDMSGELLISSQAVRSERIKIPIGEVDAVLVVSSVTMPGLQESVREMEREMANAGMSGSIDMRFSGSIRTWYAPSVQAVVKEVFHIDMVVDARLKMEGQDVDIHAVMDIDVTSLLAGADLAPTAGLDEAGVVAFLGSSAAVHDPTGRFDAPTAAYVIETQLDKSRINAAEDGVVNVDVLGVPEGHTAKYALLDANGKPRAAGEGTQFALNIAEPGAYSLLVRAYDGQRLQAQQATPLTADWIASSALACQAALGSTSPCDEANVPAFAGMSSLRIALTSQGTGGLTPSAGGTLIVRDGQGNEQSFTAANGMATITSVEGLEPGMWSVEWQPTVGVLEQATLDVELLYGPATSQAEGGMLRFLDRLELPYLDQLPLPALPF